MIGPELRQRFRRDWRAVTGAASEEPALIAVSGGIDSTALLLLFSALGAAPTPPVAATVDHGLRAASSAEAGQVADLCRRLGVPHCILAGELPPRVGRTANLSARARSLRYRLLADHAQDVGARWIVTAHHADDQLETVVMRLNRGSGVGGLAGIRVREGVVVRPLLGWTHAELSALVTAAGIAAIDDPTNSDDRFDRARLRKQLAGADWLDPQMAARSAAALGEADAAIEWAAAEWEQKLCLFDDGQAILILKPIPAELSRRLVARCLRRVDPTLMLRGADLTRLIQRLERADAATIGRVRCALALVHHEGLPAVAWSFRPAPPRRSS